jgi:hypothetical protein
MTPIKATEAFIAFRNTGADTIRWGKAIMGEYYNRNIPVRGLHYLPGQMAQEGCYEEYLCRQLSDQALGLFARSVNRYAKNRPR